MNDYKDISNYLNPHFDKLISYKLLRGLDKAVNRIIKAIYEKEKILIYGDYDVDGMTSIALLYSILKKHTPDVYYYIPDRTEEGYGLSETGMNFIIKYKITLMITVDCGITSFHEIKKLNNLKIDTIITDHHQPLEEKPDAFTIINPKCCDYPFKELAGVGVAFKLAQALSFELEGNDNDVKQNLDLVALGTIADSVPLLNENRIFVKEGLLQLISNNKKGLKILLQKIQNNKKKTEVMSVKELSFELIPVLNATGRIGNPNYAVDLFLTESSYMANHLAEEMIKLNEERKTITQKILLEARKIVKGNTFGDNQKILVLSSNNWHPGIIGIIASRIMEEFGKPAMIISTCNGNGKGSGRNQGEFDFSEILAECSELLEKYGGHKYAA
ncbi:MAG: single-stranded-DNA-specific exonuclease RecJ, partial [Atribacterota bacterium]|nr:single-stranded-DNA-specific exonuclease RecJ [Atribacterota bacterium]